MSTHEVQVSVLVQVTKDDNASQIVAEALATDDRIYKVTDSTPKLIYSTT